MHHGWVLTWKNKLIKNTICNIALKSFSKITICGRSKLLARLIIVKTVWEFVIPIMRPTTIDIVTRRFIVRTINIHFRKHTGGRVQQILITCWCLVSNLWKVLLKWKNGMEKHRSRLWVVTSQLDWHLKPNNHRGHAPYPWKEAR